jgi:hypothetical protein
MTSITVTTYLLNTLGVYVRIANLNYISDLKVYIDSLRSDPTLNDTVHQLLNLLNMYSYDIITLNSNLSTFTIGADTVELLIESVDVVNTANALIQIIRNDPNINPTTLSVQWAKIDMNFDLEHVLSINNVISIFSRYEVFYNNSLLALNRLELSAFKSDVDSTTNSVTNAINMNNLQQNIGTQIKNAINTVQPVTQTVTVSSLNQVNSRVITLSQQLNSFYTSLNAKISSLQQQVNAEVSLMTQLALIPHLVAQSTSQASVVQTLTQNVAALTLQVNHLALQISTTNPNSHLTLVNSRLAALESRVGVLDQFKISVAESLIQIRSAVARFTRGIGF